MHPNAPVCPHCNGAKKINVKVGWRPNPKDKVGFMPPIVEYEKQPCPECNDKAKQ